VDSSSTLSRTPAWATASVASTSGTLIAKIQRHDASCTSTPPPSGPTTSAMPVHAVHEPIAAPRSDAPNVAVISARLLGTSAAPAIPWMPRATISSSGLGASAHSSDSAPKPARPIMNTRLRPKMSPSEPPTSSSAPSVSM
jgi:hypothetical protein